MIALICGIALICSAYYLLGSVCLPVTLWRDDLRGYNGRNWPGLIVMQRGLECPGAVWAQELYEARFRWWFLPLDGVLVLIGRTLPAVAFYERAFELMGHEVEVQAEVRLRGSSVPIRRVERITELRAREARALSSYRAFAGWTVAEIAAEMAKRSNSARLWVEGNLPEISKVNKAREARG